MSEDNKNLNDDSKNEIEQLKREKAAIEMKLRRADDDLYSEEYLNFLQAQKEKQPPQDNFMSGGKLSDYSEEELGEMKLHKMIPMMMGEVYSRLKSEEDIKMTKEERVKRKKEVAATKKEIEKFAEDHSDFWNFASKIDEIALKNPNLNTKQLYQLAGGKLEEKPPEKKQEPKQEPKKEIAPNTRPQNEGGMKKSTSNLSRREIIQQEYQKLK